MNQSQLDEYLLEGFLVLPDNRIFLENSIEAKMYDSAFSVKFYESDETTVRSYYGFHRDPEISKWIEENETIKSICRTIYGQQEIYIHQSKINIKNKAESSVWPYHRDFPFWNVFDGIKENKLLNLVLFLDDVNSDNGALGFIPGSQNFFLEREENFKDQSFSIEGSASSNLLFDFTDEEVEMLRNKFGHELSVGSKGSILLFDPNTIHGSSFSSENFSRKLLILTFNVCSNRPVIPAIRPDYLCSTNFTPLQLK
jgi:ectoine hydroxylase-related dioxygenase (phytanoyl-CoA dioxygenase family)